MPKSRTWHVYMFRYNLSLLSFHLLFLSSSSSSSFSSFSSSSSSFSSSSSSLSKLMISIANVYGISVLCRITVYLLVFVVVA